MIHATPARPRRGPLAAITMASLLLTALGACKSKSESGAEAKSTAEVEAEATNPTIRSICEKRKKAWTKASYRACTTCQAEASTPKCGDCNKKPHAAQCASVNGALISNKECDEARICKIKCRRGDCDCEEKCFEGKPKCAKLAAIVDACVTEECMPICE